MLTRKISVPISDPLYWQFLQGYLRPKGQEWNHSHPSYTGDQEFSRIHTKGSGKFKLRLPWRFLYCTEIVTISLQLYGSNFTTSKWLFAYLKTLRPNFIARDPIHEIKGSKMLYLVFIWDWIFHYRKLTTLSPTTSFATEQLCYWEWTIFHWKKKYIFSF